MSARKRKIRATAVHLRSLRSKQERALRQSDDPRVAATANATATANGKTGRERRREITKHQNSSSRLLSRRRQERRAEKEVRREEARKAAAEAAAVEHAKKVKEDVKEGATRLEKRNEQRRDSLCAHARRACYEAFCVLNELEGALLEDQLHVHAAGQCAFMMLEGYAFCVGDSRDPAIQQRKWKRSGELGGGLVWPVGEFVFEDDHMLYQVCVQGLCHHDPPHEFTRHSSASARAHLISPAIMGLRTSRATTAITLDAQIADTLASDTPDWDHRHRHHHHQRHTVQSSSADSEKSHGLFVDNVWVCEAGSVHYCGRECRSMLHRTESGRLKLQMQPEHTIACPLTGTLADDVDNAVNRWYGTDGYVSGYRKLGEFQRMVREMNSNDTSQSLFVRYYGCSEFAGSTGRRAGDDESLLAFDDTAVCTKDMMTIARDMLKCSTIDELDRIYGTHVKRKQPLVPRALKRRLELVRVFERMRSYTLTAFRAIIGMLCPETDSYRARLKARVTDRTKNLQLEYVKEKTRNSQVVNLVDLVAITQSMRNKNHAIMKRPAPLPSNIEHRLFNIVVPYTLMVLKLWGVMMRNGLFPYTGTREAANADFFHFAYGALYVMSDGLEITSPKMTHKTQLFRSDDFLLKEVCPPTGALRRMNLVHQKFLEARTGISDTVTKAFREMRISTRDLRVDEFDLRTILPAHLPALHLPPELLYKMRQIVSPNNGRDVAKSGVPAAGTGTGTGAAASIEQTRKRVKKWHKTNRNDSYGTSRASGSGSRKKRSGTRKR